MKHLIWAVVLWLGCIPALFAWQEKAEVLVYDVRWGPLYLGKAALAYSPGKFETYALEARVRDDSMLMEIDDVWRTEGVWREGRWQPKTYHMLQRENDYRADKVVTFKGNKAVYVNRRGGEEDLTIDLPEGARDALSTLYDLRAQGMAVLPVARTVQVLGVKKVFPLEIKPAVKEGEVWRVDMYAHNPDKGRMDRWRVWLTDDADLVPVKLEARMKLGTFVATLRQGK